MKWKDLFFSILYQIFVMSIYVNRLILGCVCQCTRVFSGRDFICNSKVQLMKVDLQETNKAAG